MSNDIDPEYKLNLMTLLKIVLHIYLNNSIEKVEFLKKI